MREAVAESAMRAGLFACGDLAVALRCASGQRLDDPHDLVAALRDVPALGALVRFAFAELR